jgi:hypothetical protein
MHAPFLGLKVNRNSTCLQGKFEGKGQGQTPILLQLVAKELGSVPGLTAIKKPPDFAVGGSCEAGEN